mgnify:CR=1 FL=1
MNDLYFIVGGDITIWKGQRLADGKMYPPNIGDHWSDVDLAAIGLFRLVPDVVPEGKVIVSSTLVLEGIIIRQIHTLADAPPETIPQSVSKLELVRAMRVAALDTQFFAAISSVTLDHKEDWGNMFVVPKEDEAFVAIYVAAGITLTQINALFTAANSQ